MPFAFERSILTSPGRFKVSTAILYEYPDINNEFAEATTFVGLDYDQNPVFLTAYKGNSSPTKKIAQAFSVNNQGTITAGTTLQLTTYIGGYQPTCIAGQSHGAYRYNAGTPITATNGGYLYAMGIYSTGATTSTLSALKIKEDTLAITEDATESANRTQEYAFFLDNLSQETWAFGPVSKGGEPTYYKRKYTGTASIVDQKEWWDSASHRIYVSTSNATVRAIGESSANAYLVAFTKTDDSTVGMVLQAHQIWTDSTTWSWQEIKSANDLEARLNTELLFNLTVYPELAQISNYKFLCGGTRTTDKTKFDYAVAEATFDTSSPYTTNPSWTTSSTTSTLDLTSILAGQQNLRGKLVETNIADTVYAVFPVYRTLVENGGVWVSGEYDSLLIYEFKITGTSASIQSTNRVILPFPIDESEWADNNYRITSYGKNIVFCASNARFTKMHAVVITSRD